MLHDRDLVSAVLSGDREAQEALLSRCRPLVRGFAHGRYRLSASDAEDLYQSLAVRLLENDCRALRAWRGEGKLSSYLTVIVTRMSLERLRKQPREEPLETVAERASLEPTVEQQLSRRELLVAVRSCLEALSPRDRLLLTLRYGDELAPRDIAKLVGLVPATARKALFDARGRLELALQKDHPELVREGTVGAETGSIAGAC